MKHLLLTLESKLPVFLSAYFVQVMQLLVTMGVGGGLVYLLQKILTLRWHFITDFKTRTVILY